MIEDSGAGVKSKTSTKFIERIAKHPNRWDLVKMLSQRMAEVYFETTLVTELPSN
jgi:hypothetical protein